MSKKRSRTFSVESIKIHNILVSCLNRVSNSIMSRIFNLFLTVTNENYVYDFYFEHLTFLRYSIYFIAGRRTGRKTTNLYVEISI